ncbi:MAG: hypothetical protein WC583_02740 [Candidatus Omnitrophota bacterium]|jgi:hypothetical protein|nr:hypothetical protein [Sphaerochaeta sp.]
MPRLPIGDKGPCEVVWKYGESGEIVLGPFLGAVLFKGETGTSPINESRYGNSPVDAVYTGTEATLELSMTRSTYEQLEEVLNSEVQGTPPNEYLPLINQLGCSLRDMAHPIAIKPICNNVVSEDETEWLIIYEATPVVGWNLSYDMETQRTFPVKFLVFPSEESGKEGWFGTLGAEPLGV